MRELIHLSLFSGIGGMDLAAELAEIKTVGQCEWADYPTKVLQKHWPDVPRWKDIRTLTGESFYERTGLRTVDIISGGFPCQPFSVAGKQRGKEDDRYLWPEMVRVIKELRPTWVVGENVAGIVKMALPDILSELGGLGYRTRAFLIPACAVGARHRRYRVAIVGYAEHNGPSAATVTGGIAEASGREQEGQGKAGEPSGAGEPGNSEDVANTDNSKTARYREHSREIYSEPEPEGFDLCGSYVDVCNAAGKGLQDRTGQPVGGQGTPEPEPERPDSNGSDTNDRSGALRRDGEFSTTEETGSGWRDIERRAPEHEPGQRRPTESRLDRMAHGFSCWLDGDIDFLLNHYWDTEPDIPRIATGIPNRVNRLKALGNAVVPQQFYPIFKAIAAIESTQEETDGK